MAARIDPDPAAPPAAPHTSFAPPAAVVLAPIGGLGNQMFQVWNFLALQHRLAPILDPLGATFHLVRRPANRKRGIFWHSAFAALRNYLVDTTAFLAPIQATVVREPHFHFDPTFSDRVAQAVTDVARRNRTRAPPPLSVVHLEGYVQSDQYFRDLRTGIYTQLQLDAARELVRQKFMPAPSSDRHVTRISLHFRHGDYARLPDHHPILPLAYYTRSLHAILATLPDATWPTDPTAASAPRIEVCCFFEATDQATILRYIETLAAQFPALTFVPMHRRGMSDWEEMLAMSLCDHHIIANSTFSWWGAYLHECAVACARAAATPDTPQPPSPHVYYPAVWFGPAFAHYQLHDLCPAEWNRDRGAAPP